MVQFQALSWVQKHLTEHIVNSASQSKSINKINSLAGSVRSRLRQFMFTTLGLLTLISYVVRCERPTNDYRVDKTDFLKGH